MGPKANKCNTTTTQNASMNIIDLNDPARSLDTINIINEITKHGIAHKMP